MKRLSMVISALALAACSPEQNAGEPASAPEAKAESPTTVETPGGAVVIQPLTQDGWGEVKIGMTHDQAVAALGGKTKPDASTKDDMWKACHMVGATDPDGLYLMIEN